MAGLLHSYDPQQYAQNKDHSSSVIVQPAKSTFKTKVGWHRRTVKKAQWTNSICSDDHPSTFNKESKEIDHSKTPGIRVIEVLVHFPENNKLHPFSLLASSTITQLKLKLSRIIQIHPSRLRLRLGLSNYENIEVEAIEFVKDIVSIGSLVPNYLNPQMDEVPNKFESDGHKAQKDMANNKNENIQNLSHSIESNIDDKSHKTTSDRSIFTVDDSFVEGKSAPPTSSKLELTLTITPIDTDTLMRKGKNIKRFVTYDAWLASHEMKRMENKSKMATLKKEKEQLDKKRHLMNQDAFNSWCLLKKEEMKLFSTGSKVQLTTDYSCELFAPNDKTVKYRSRKLKSGEKLTVVSVAPRMQDESVQTLVLRNKNQLSSNQTASDEKNNKSIDPNWYIVSTRDGWHSEVPAAFLVSKPTQKASSLTTPVAPPLTTNEHNRLKVDHDDEDENYEEDFCEEDEGKDKSVSKHAIHQEKNEYNKDGNASFEEESFEENQLVRSAADILEDRNKWVDREWRKLQVVSVKTSAFTEVEVGNTKSDNGSEEATKAQEEEKGGDGGVGGENIELKENVSPSDNAPTTMSRKESLKIWLWLLKRMKGKHVKASHVFHQADTQRCGLVTLLAIKEAMTSLDIALKDEDYIIFHPLVSQKDDHFNKKNEPRDKSQETMKQRGHNEEDYCESDDLSRKNNSLKCISQLSFMTFFEKHRKVVNDSLKRKETVMKLVESNHEELQNDAFESWLKKKSRDHAIATRVSKLTQKMDEEALVEMKRKKWSKKPVVNAYSTMKATK